MNPHKQVNTARVLLQQRSSLWFCFGFLGWDDYGCGYLVVGFEVEEFDSVGGVACGSDGLGVDADDLSELANAVSSLMSVAAVQASFCEMGVEFSPL